jgi:hypothetical protein
MEGVERQQQHAGSLSMPVRARVAAELEHGGHMAVGCCARSAALAVFETGRDQFSCLQQRLTARISSIITPKPCVISKNSNDQS